MKSCLSTETSEKQKTIVPNCSLCHLAMSKRKNWDVKETVIFLHNTTINNLRKCFTLSNFLMYNWKSRCPLNVAVCWSSAAGPEWERETKGIREVWKNRAEGDERRDNRDVAACQMLLDSHEDGNDGWSPSGPPTSNSTSDGYNMSAFVRL